jgi:hypothetical protein
MWWWWWGERTAADPADPPEQRPPLWLDPSVSESAAELASRRLVMDLYRMLKSGDGVSDCLLSAGLNMPGERCWITTAGFLLYSL